MIYVTLEQIIEVQQILLQKYGGSSGIRDQGLLESAIHRPQASVFGKEAYPTLFDKAAVICQSLLMNHAFVDGNKRVAFAACHLTLLSNEWDLTTDSEKTYDFLISVIHKHTNWPEISAWLKQHSKKI